MSQSNQAQPREAAEEDEQQYTNAETTMEDINKK